MTGRPATDQAFAPEPMWTVTELSPVINTAPSTIYWWVHEGFIPDVKIGRCVRFRPSEIMAWLEYNGQGNDCLHQDQTNISVTKGRKQFAGGCREVEEEVITADLLHLDNVLRETIAVEEQRHTECKEALISPRCGPVEEGADAYYRLHTARDGTILRTPITSFIIVPRARIWIDEGEAIRADLQTAAHTIIEVTFERHHWHSRMLFLKALSSLDLWSTASDSEVQCIQAIVAGKPVSRKQGTRALGYREGRWITEDGVLDSRGWMADPPIIYLPHAGESPLAGRVNYRNMTAAEGIRVAKAFYEGVWRLNELSVIDPTIGWFFATPFKSLIHRRLTHFPIFDCWGTKGAGKTSLLELFWQLFGVTSELLSCTETEFALLTLLASTTSIPLVFDEFKPYDIRPEQVKRFERMLRRVYQGEVEHRGRPDLRLIPYRLTAPVAVAGEVPVTTQPALVERVIPVSPSPQWLAEHDAARASYAALMQLPLDAFAPFYIQWALQRDFARDFAKAERMLQEALDQRRLPERVRHNLLAIVFGLCQFEAFGHTHALEVPDQLDIKAIIDSVIKEVCTPEGSTRTALDELMQHLATLAEMGCLIQGQHYTYTSDKQLALRLDLCLAEFRKFMRETMLEGEVLTKAAYQRQLRENKEAGGYVRDTSALAAFAGVRKRAVVVDPGRADKAGLDLTGLAA